MKYDLQTFQFIFLISKSDPIDLGWVRDGDKDERSGFLIFIVSSRNYNKKELQVSNKYRFDIYLTGAGEGTLKVVLIRYY